MQFVYLVDSLFRESELDVLSHFALAGWMSVAL
jgi:hypothetical protein